MPEPNGAMSTDLDRAGLAQVVTDVDERHGQALFGFARRLGLGPDQADDAVQEVLMRLYRALEGGTVIDDARGWSFRTIYRIAMDEHRLRRRLDGLRERLGWTQRLGREEDVAGSISLWSDVDRLPARQRQVVYKADLTFDEIASTM
ncbi:MAG TPA: sigma-70 family RNA polymerase sigma factor, partial [Candidatus Limnocylindrales bacterium]